MKYCPQCRTAYTDDALRFCLKDGTSLTETPDANFDTSPLAHDDAATIISRKPPQQVIRINVPEDESENRRQNDFQSPRSEQVEQSPGIAPPIAEKKSNTALTVLATVLGMLVVLGIIGAGAWFLLDSRKNNVAVVNVNTAPANRPPNVNAANVQIANVNANKPTASPTVTPTPKPSLAPEAIEAVTNDVEDAIDEWTNSSENLDIDGNLNQYADTVDYYVAGRVNRARVRADKQRAFAQFDSVNFDISNVKITPDGSGEKATAVFDKEWRFEGAEKRSAGKVQQQLTLGKIGGRWLITGERDLKTYYVEN